jgi:hypothetical protein
VPGTGTWTGCTKSSGSQLIRIEATAADHVSAGPFGQQLAPFSGLAAAAAVTTRPRLGTLVVTGKRRADTEDLIARRGWSL